MAEIAMDALDKAILTALLADGRQSQVELAERVPLSPTAIGRRIRALEQSGVISGYEAQNQSQGPRLYDDGRSADQPRKPEPGSAGGVRDRPLQRPRPSCPVT